MTSFFAAIGAALRAAFTFIRAAILVPARLVSSLLGTGAEAPPLGDSPLVEHLKAEYEEAQAELQTAGRKTAALVAAWCADSMIAGRPLPAPTPPMVSRAVSNWICGLLREECAELVCAGAEGVSEHIAGVCEIPGVRPVQPLAALSAWTRAPAYEEPTPGIAAIAYAEGGLSST